MSEAENTTNTVEGTGVGAKAKRETVIEVVTMKDGAVVEFAGKRKLIKNSFERDGNVVVRLNFRNAEFREFTLPQNLLNKFASHGAEQKLGDEIAGIEDIDDSILAIDELIERLYNGEWNVKRESSGIAGTSILLRALVKLTGKPVEDVKVFLKGKTNGEKLALRNSDRLRPIIQELEAEKAKGNVNVDNLFAELA